MSSSTLVEFARNAMSLRIACLAAAESNLEICKLGAHVWLYGWKLCGFPQYRIGSLCRQGKRTFLLCFGTLLEDFRAQPRFEPLGFSVADDGWDKPLDQLKAVQLIPNPLVFECVFRGEASRLPSFPREELTVVVSFGGINALHYSAVLGEVDCFSALLRRLGGSVNANLLHCCDARFPFGDRLGVLDVLLEQGNLSIADNKDSLQEMLETAANFGAEWMISWIFSNFGDDFDLNFPLCLASEEGHTGCCRLLIHSGANVNHLDAQGWTALMLASKEGRAGCCRLLLESGANVNPQEENGWMALMLASELGHTDCCRLLLEFGADVSLCDVSGWTALMLASEKGHVDCCHLLIDCGAGVDLQNQNGWTALMYASRKGHAECCRLLIESGADANLPLEDRGSVLVLASQNGHTDCCRLLIDSGVDVNLQTNFGSTALIWASSRGHADCCRLLIESGADVNLQNRNGWTAFMWASENGHTDCCRLLTK